MSVCSSSSSRSPLISRTTITWPISSPARPRTGPTVGARRRAASRRRARSGPSYTCGRTRAPPSGRSLPRPRGDWRAPRPAAASRAQESRRLGHEPLVTVREHHASCEVDQADAVAARVQRRSVPCSPTIRARCARTSLRTSVRRTRPRRNQRRADPESSRSGRRRLLMCQHAQAAWRLDCCSLGRIAIVHPRPVRELAVAGACARASARVTAREDMPDFAESRRCNRRRSQSAPRRCRECERLPLASRVSAFSSHRSHAESMNVVSLRSMTATLQSSQIARVSRSSPRVVGQVVLAVQRDQPGALAVDRRARDRAGARTGVPSRRKRQGWRGRGSAAWHAVVNRRTMTTSTIYSVPQSRG